MCKYAYVLENFNKTFIIFTVRNTDFHQILELTSEHTLISIALTVASNRGEYSLLLSMCRSC
jgi:hypothetical protein